MGQRLKRMQLGFWVGIVQGIIWAILSLWLKPTRREKWFARLYFVGLFTGAWGIWHDARTNGTLNRYIDRAAEAAATGLETAATSLRRQGSRKTPEELKAICEDIAKINAEIKSGLSWTEIELKFTSDRGRDFYRYWEPFCRKNGGVEMRE